MAVKRYDGSAWQVVAGKGDQGTSSSISTWVKTASGGETSLSGNDDNSQSLSYTVGQELVFINGTLLKRGSDYTATNGTSITGLTALAANDVATVWTVNAFSVTNAISNTLVDAKGDLLVGTAADTPGRLAVGTNGQVLTAASTTGTGLTWATPASGGMTLISTTTMTGSGVTLSSIPSTYNHLQLVIRSFKPATDGGLYIRFNNDGNTRYYSNVSNDLYTSGTSYNASSFTVSNTQDSGGDNGLIVVDIFDYTNTATWKFVNSSALTQHGTTNTDLNYRFGFGAWNQTSAISQLDFYPASGNFTSGTILLYGVK